MSNNNRLRIAIQKSGRLSKDCQALLKQLGVKLNLREQRLIAHSTNMPIDVLRVRDDDIPGLVMDGVCDLGIVGENVLEEVQAERVRNAQAAEVKKALKTRLWFLPPSISLATRAWATRQSLVQWQTHCHHLPRNP